MSAPLSVHVDFSSQGGSIVALEANKRRNMAAGLKSAMLRQEIEAKLSSRIPAALSPQPQQAPRLLPIGIPEIDQLLGGGLPLGGITEFSGAPGSGRTSLAYAALRAASQEAACAYIDAQDALDPYSAAAAGVHLANLLWVRFPAVEARQIEPAAGRRSDSSAEYLRRMSQAGRYGHHPREETRGVDAALVKMLEKKAEARMHKAQGTPGYPNQRLTLAAASEDQIAFDHFNARRADASDPLRQLDRIAAEEARMRAAAVHGETAHAEMKAKSEKPWSRLDKVIRATDQVLQSGGFRIVVLDLGSTPAEQALRIPSATWFRFRRAAQEGDAILLLLTQQPCARSSASCVLECSANGTGGSAKTVLTAVSYSAEVARQRQSHELLKKAPGRVASWTAVPEWMRTGSGQR